jgi:hypothetical protein
MAGLLDEVCAAHGGIERWRAVTAVTANGTFAGLLRSRFPGNRMSKVTVRVQAAEQHAVFEDFPRAGERAVFDRGDVRIETGDGELLARRRHARTAFVGLDGLRRNLRWDPLDATYFAGYAWWNYLLTPILLTRPGVTISESGTWSEGGEQWRRVDVRFSSDIHTHSPRQTFYIDPRGLICRHDYTAGPVGRWAHAAHYCGEHKRFAGLIFATRRRVCPRGPGARALHKPVLVALDIDRLDVET